MIAGQSVAVVVPARDEARWIESVLASMPPLVDLVVVVDDDSNDGTAIRAANASCSCPVVVLRQLTNDGVGVAIVRGYRHAAAHGADILVVMAGDGQMDPADLPALVAPLARGDADYVKGNRLRHPQVWSSMPRERRLGSYVLSLLTSAAIGHVIGDSQCGYTALRTTMFEQLDCSALWPRYGYPNDLLGALALEHARIAEVIVRPVYRGERSGMRPRHAVLIMALIARVAARRGWRTLLDSSKAKWTRRGSRKTAAMGA